MKRLAVFLVVLAAVAFGACKEEYSQQDLHILNPMSETDPTDPAGDDDDDVADATIDASATDATTTDAKTDAKPADAKVDAKDATGQ